MSKFLSDCLEAKEPYFHNDLRHYESVSGHPSADIRTSIEVEQGTRTKLSELGLDPSNTRPEEVYYILQEKVVQADRDLVKHLRSLAASKVSAEANLIDGMSEVLTKHVKKSKAFVVKSSVIRRLLKENPPKQAIKRLGYRSLDSFIKREPISQILLAAKLYEGRLWQKKYFDQISHLSASDFEEQATVIHKLTTKRWQKLTEDIVNREKQSVIRLSEIGTVILLPLPANITDGMTIASLGMALIDQAEISYNSSLLKLIQVRPDFGKVAASVFQGQASLTSAVLKQTLPWSLVHRHISELSELPASILQPHINVEDLKLQSIETSLSKIVPHLAFFEGTDHLAYLHETRPVSLNLMDAAINCANQLDYSLRTTRFFAESLWQRLMSRYLTPHVVEQLIGSQLEPAYAVEKAGQNG